MKILIYNTETRAKSAAKNEAISQAEKQFQIVYTAKTEKQLRYNKNWLIRYTETRCACGQTSAIEATLFHRKQQFTGYAGYCDYCGSAHPMP